MLFNHRPRHDRNIILGALVVLVVAALLLAFHYTDGFESRSEWTSPLPANSSSDLPSLSVKQNDQISGSGETSPIQLEDSPDPVRLGGDEFSTSTAPGKANAIYAFAVTNGNDVALELRLADITLPTHMHLIRGRLPELAMLAPRSHAKLELEIHFDECSNISTDVSPIKFPARQVGGSWKLYSITPPGVGPDGRWQLEAMHAACYGQ